MAMRKIRRPSKEELTRLWEENKNAGKNVGKCMGSIAGKYSVSSNTVRNWIIEDGLHEPKKHQIR